MRLTSILLPCLVSVALSSCADTQSDSEPLSESAIPVATDSAPLCDMAVTEPMRGFAAMNVLAWIDVPDSDSVRATAPLENWLAGQLAREGIAPPLIKAYCQIGLTDMVTDYRHAIEGDDALIGKRYRAIYRWNAEAEFPGWELSQLGERTECARGRDESSQLCL